MQRAEGPSSRLAPEPTPTRPSLSPPVAFLVLVVVIGIIGAIFYLTRPDAPATPTNPNAAQEPDFSLTNEQAITRFEELQRLHLLAYAAADATLVDQVFTENGQIGETVRQEIVQLTRDEVSARFTYDTRDLQPIRNTPSEIELEQVAVVDASFFDRFGDEITSKSPAELQKIAWTLRLVGDKWLIHDAVVLSSREVPDG